MSGNENTGSERGCPVCGETMYQQGAPGVYWCPECRMEYWREGNGWWRCDESGEPENVKAVADGGTARPAYPRLAGRLETTTARLRRTRRMNREHERNQQIDDHVTAALAELDAALDLARGEDGCR